MSSVPQLDLFEAAQNEVMLRVNNALEKKDLEPHESAVLKALTHPPRLGRSSAFGISAMQKYWHASGQKIYSDRQIKSAVKNLLEEYGVPIGSCRTPGKNGYYLLTSPEDIAETERPLRNEIYSIFGRLKAYSPNSHFVRSLAGQMDLLKREEAGPNGI